MDKNTVKNTYKKYAVWAREELKKKVTAKAVENEIVEGQQFDDTLESINGEVLSETRRNQRRALIKKIEEDGYDQVMEEVAYTWFNRFIAIRFMEVNGYLPSHVRVFSDESGKFNPQIVTEAIHLDLVGLDMERVMELKDAENNDELFKYLLIVQCNALNEILPMMFQKLEDYTELLLPDYLLREGSVIEKLVNDIPDEYFNVNADEGQIEIIGWMYQYYISEKHEEVVDPLHGKVVKKEEVPAATQLFTTDWVVQYLIDNSVGRYWIERNPDSKLADELTYFVKPKDGAIKTVDEKITPQDVTVFDPCVGSGHFLVYAFEVLMKIYIEYGYSERDAAAEIVKNNLYGLDIDGRATQLAYFAVMMKARQYDRRFFGRGIQPHIYEILESNNVDSQSVEHFCGNDTVLKKDVGLILDALKDAKEYGSIIQIPEVSIEKISERFAQLENEISIYNTYLLKNFRNIISIAELLKKKYAIVATNPPYLNRYDANLKKYINSKYADYKGDLFSVFIYRNLLFGKHDGYTCYMTPMVWMFIKTYEKLREVITLTKQISSLIQFEYSAFDEATVPICAFVIRNGIQDDNGIYFKLTDFRGGMQRQCEKVLEALGNMHQDWVYEINQKCFERIPGYPIAYWITDKVLDIYDSGTPLGEIAAPRKGNSTSDNNRFLRLWHEVDAGTMNLHATEIDIEDSKRRRWYPYNKGGGYRKWYGFNEYLIDWYDDAAAIRSIKTAVIANYQYFMKPGLTWSTVTTADFSIRWFDEGYIFDNGGCCIFELGDKREYLCGLLNSVVFKYIFGQLNPTLNFQSGEVAKFPVIMDDNARITELVDECVKLSKDEYDNYENSWDFKRHPLVSIALEKNDSGNDCLLEDIYNIWEQRCDKTFYALKENEEELNRIFIDIYGLQGEVSPEILEKDITVRKADKQRDVRSLISYAVGCMFGRYSLDEVGLAYAGGVWNSSKYNSFIPDQDAIVPICDDEYFDDDIVGRFIEFVKTVFGSKNLEDNLRFIADAIGGNGASRDILRNYFVNDFYTDHLRSYQKRPIYWLFDSGKKNGFKCLVYMHRYKADTIARIRTDYVHEQQARYRTAIEELANRMNTVSGSEKIKITKKYNTLMAQDEEIHSYEEKIHHLADKMINIDLNDGVKHNYEVFKDVLAKIK